MKTALSAMRVAILAWGTLGAQSPPSVILLEAGKPLESSLTGDQAISYRIETVDANRFCDATVEQRGIDVVVSLFSPEGKKLAEVDSPNGAVGPERL